MDEFVVARNPDERSALPFLVKVPLRGEGVVLKVREVWPRTAKVYCHPSTDWPEEPEVVERVPVRSCVRRGASIDLVLDRSRENRSQFVFTRARGRDVIFWQSARTSKQARPNVGLPRRRASGLVLDILVDTRERYPWTFGGQQATTRRAPLPAGDYAVAVDGVIVGSVERKSLADLATTISTGKFHYLLAGLNDVPRSAVVVEDRYSSLFKLTHVRGAVLAEALATAQVTYPTVPVIFCETRPLAQEWAYRFLGAAAAHHLDDTSAAGLADELPPGGPIAPPPPTAGEIRAWAAANGFEISGRGRIPKSIVAAFESRGRS